MDGFSQLLARHSAVDQHAHNVRSAEHALPFEASFSEANDSKVWSDLAPHGLFYRRSMRQLAELYNTGPESVRDRVEGHSLKERTHRCLAASKLQYLLLDDGLAPHLVMPWQWHSQFVPTMRLQRLEAVADELLSIHADFDSFEEAFKERFAHTGSEVVGFKCIAAYRGGLRVSQPSRAEAEECFQQGRRQLQAGPFYHYLIHLMLEIAQERGLPVQFHTGFGDPDLALEESNPLLMRQLIEQYSCPFALLHAGYPYCRESGFLASVYHHVWVDFGLAVPYLSTHGMRETVSALLEFAPLNRIMYSSDASLIPELYYLGSVNGRAALEYSLRRTVDHGDLSWTEAEQAARWILRENACSLYRLR